MKLFLILCFIVPSTQCYRVLEKHRHTDVVFKYKVVKCSNTQDTGWFFTAASVDTGFIFNY